MNLLFLNSIEEETYGGVEEWTRLVATALSARGHHVTIAGRRGSEYLRRTCRPDTGVDPLPLDISGDFNPVTIARLKRYMADHDIDAVVVNFNKDVRLGGLAARWEIRPRVIWRVGLDITKDNVVHRFLTPRLVDGIIVPSQSLKTQITRSGYIDPAIVQVIPNAIEDADYVRPGRDAALEVRRAHGLTDSAVVAANVGRYVNQKGHRYLVEAASAVVADHPDVVFLLVGDGPLRDALRSRIARAGLQRHFVLTGMVDRVDAILAGADLMVHAAVEEPFGIALIEAMRAGIPIVATRVGGIPEVVLDGRSGILVEPCNPSALAAATTRLLAHPERMKDMGQEGHRRWQDEFRLETMVTRVERYLTDFVAERSRRA